MMQKVAESSIKEEMHSINPDVFKDKVLVRESLLHLLKAREELDDFIDTLEMLSDPKFRKDLECGLRQCREGKVISGSIDDLKKQIMQENV